MKRIVALILLAALFGAEKATDARAGSSPGVGDAAPSRVKTPSVFGPGGIVYAPEGERIGKIDDKGVLYDNYGNLKAKVHPDGRVTDPYGNQIGKIRRR